MFELKEFNFEIFSSDVFWTSGCSSADCEVTDPSGLILVEKFNFWKVDCELTDIFRLAEIVS